MQSRTSIYHKLILYIFFLGIFVIVVVSLFSFITARNAILQRTYNQLISLRVAKREQVEQFFNDRIKEVELFSHQENLGVIHYKRRITDGEITFQLPNEDLNVEFIRFFKSAGYYKNIYIINSRNIRCYNLDSTYSNYRFTNVAGKLFLNSLILRVQKDNRILIQDYKKQPDDSIPHLFIVSPMCKVGVSDSSVVIFEVKSSAINSILKNKGVSNGLGKSGEIYLVGPDSLMRSESRFITKSILKMPVKTESVKRALAFDEGTIINKDYRGIFTLSSYSRLGTPDLGWVIIAEIDKKEAMRPIYKLANEIVFLSIFITLILFIVAYIISSNIAGPIIKLKDATDRVRKGEFDVILHIKSKDELGELNESFNLMTRQLKLQQQELKEREVRVFTSFIDGQEDERQRLSRELHDGLGQLIIATKLKSESMVNSENGINSSNISRLRLMFDSLVDEVRSISNNLMPPVLQEFGLEIALNQICKEIAKHSQIKVIFESQIPDRELDKRIVVYIFRIAQEALNNAVKHSGASEIIMSLIGNEKMISLMVQDDGTGINIDEPCNQKGRGINSMCERVKLLNGLIDISKGENHGTIVSVKIPLISDTGI